MTFKVIILGGTGFIGRAVVKNLSDIDEIELLIGTRNKSRAERNENYFYVDLAERICVDSTIARHLADCDLVLNFAGQIEDESLMWAVNYDGPRKLASLFLRKENPNKKYWIQLSSCGVFEVEFNKDIGLESRRSGRNLYEQTKLSLDEYFKQLGSSDRFQVHTFYPSVVINKDDQRVARLKKLLRTSFFRMFISPKWNLNFVGLDQVVSEITDLVLSIKRGNWEAPRVGSEKILNQPLNVRCFAQSGDWKNLSSITQWMVEVALGCRFVKGKLQERLLFLFSNVKYK